jgi:hypothetical protein
MQLQLRIILVLSGLLSAAACHPAQAQHNSWRGFAIGEATIDDITSRLGPSPIETAGRHDLRYPSTQDPKLNDRLYFVNSKLQLAQSASADSRYPNRTAIEKAFGTPEAEVVFQTQEYLDYSEDGFRFICAADGTTTGILSFAPVPRRVPRGYPNTRINLRREPHAAGSPISTTLKVGAAEISIAPKTLQEIQSPDSTQELHLAEDLLARAVVFQRDEDSVVLIGLDVFGLGPWDIQQLRESLRKQGFPNVIVAMSHTHANVDTIGFYGYYPKEYAEQILQNAESAVLKAAGNLSAVSHLQSGTIEMPLAGGRVVDLIRNGRDPGLVDPAVSVFQAIGADQKPVVNIVHLACHPEVIRLKDTNGLSPDFVGTLCRKVTEQLGGQTVFLNGALGGMLTPDTRFRTQAAAEEMGARLSEFAVAAAGQAVPCSSDALFVETVSVEYPITAAAISNFLNNPPKPFSIRQGRVSADMSVIWLGDAQFVTVPGELLPDIGFEIMQEMTGQMRVIVGLANGELGYMIPGFDFRADGYEERTGPGAAGGEITRAIGLQLARRRPR